VPINLPGFLLLGVPNLPKYQEPERRRVDMQESKPKYGVWVEAGTLGGLWVVTDGGSPLELDTLEAAADLAAHGNLEASKGTWSDGAPYSARRLDS
jgi:hypothetical protein